MGTLKPCLTSTRALSLTRKSCFTQLVKEDWLNDYNYDNNK